MSVQAIASHSTIGRTHTQIGHSCTYRVSLRLTERHLASDGRGRISVVFAGSAWLPRRPAAPLVVGFG